MRNLVHYRFLLPVLNVGLAMVLVSAALQQQEIERRPVYRDGATRVYFVSVWGFNPISVEIAAGLNYPAFAIARAPSPTTGLQNVSRMWLAIWIAVVWYAVGFRFDRSRGRLTAVEHGKLQPLTSVGMLVILAITIYTILAGSIGASILVQSGGIVWALVILGIYARWLRSKLRNRVTVS